MILKLQYKIEFYEDVFILGDYINILSIESGVNIDVSLDSVIYIGLNLHGGYIHRTHRFTPDGYNVIKIYFISDIVLLSQYDNRIDKLMPQLRASKLESLLS
jgi:hypothetical protein